MRYAFRILTASALALTSSFAIAAFSDKPTISFTTSFSDLDDDRGQFAQDENGFGINLSVSKKVNSLLILETEIGATETEISSGNDFRQARAGILANIRLNRSEHIAPYFLLGAGFQRSEDANGDAQNHYADVGLGVFHRITGGGMAVRADVRLRRDFFDDATQGTTEYDDLIANIGVSIPLGQTSHVTEEEYPDIAEYENSNDIDGDGIHNQADYCPGTAADAAVDINGCSNEQAAQPRQVETPEPADTSAPETAPAPLVAQAEQPNADPVATTAPATKPSPSANNSAFQFTFQKDSAELTTAGQSTQLALARELLHRKHLSVDIHANATSKNDLNYRRAKIIRQALLRYGINGDRIQLHTSYSATDVEASLRGN